MEGMHKLKTMLERELDEFSRKDELESWELETVHKLTDTIKNIGKIQMIDEGGYSEDGYSQARGGRGGGNRGGGSSYGDEEDYSEARRRRDNRGRYSRDEGRSQMMNQLEGMMSQAGSEHEREVIRRCMEQLRGM